MLLQLRLPPSAGELRRVTEAALLVLKSLADKPAKRKAWVHLASVPGLSGLPWLLAPRQDVKDAIEAIARLPLVMRKELHRVFANDARVFLDVNQAVFVFESATLPPKAFSAGHDFMKSLYESVLSDRGFPYSGSHPISGTARLTRHVFEEEFHAANGRLLVCPACLIEELPRIVYKDGRPISSNTADHFFPKVKVPILAVYPDNLAVVCYQCNSSFKATEWPGIPNPSKNSKNSVNLQELWIPYHRHGIDEINLDFVPDFMAMILAIKIVPRDSLGPGLARWNSHERLYSVKKRWELYLGARLGDLIQEISEELAMFAPPVAMSPPGVEAVVADILDRRIRTVARLVEPGARILHPFYRWLRERRMTSIIEAVRAQPRWKAGP